MYLGRVAGCVWATAKDPCLDGRKLLIVQPVTPDLRDTGKRVVCADCTGAGVGEIVYWLRGKEASFPFLPTEVPVDTAVVGIVDSIHFKAAEPSKPVEQAKPARKR
ncbi:MAG: EutN/CcmL family microcompartment protein [Bryobacteraceae bacterium]|jgi:ethanolamine utilization protein EutN